MRRAGRSLALFGPLLVVLALSKIHAAQVADPPYDYTGSFRFAWSLAYVAILAVSGYAVGLPDLPRRRRQVVAQAVVASAAAAIGVSVLQLIVGDALLPRFVVFGAAVGVVPLHVAAAAVARRGRSRDEGRDRVVLVSSPEEARRLVADLARDPERAAVLAEVIAVAEASSGGRGTKPLVERVVGAGATVLVLDREALLDRRIVEQASPIHEAGVRVRTLVEFYDEWLGKLPVSELVRSSLFFDIGEIHRQRYGRIKRLLDVILGALGLVPLVLALPLVVVGDLLANRGPLLYRQQRVGQGGGRFEILKFRTMAPTDSDVTDTSWTTLDDPRVTPFGRFLRRSHLDELPQVLNILRGDMSVVGPRPEQPHYVAELSATLPFYGMRHLVRPGLTGWAQVKYGYAGDEDDANEKLQYEFFYLRHQGFRFDLRVIGRTLRSVLGGSGSGR